MSTATEIHEAAQRLEQRIHGRPTAPLQTRRPTPDPFQGNSGRTVCLMWEDFRLLAVVDSPTQNTGFAGVGKALLPRWAPHFSRLDVWGINYHGYPHDLPWRIFPGGRNWTAARKQMELCNLILDGDYTHVWILQDIFALSRDGMADNLRLACDKSGAKLVVYYPVDAPVEKSWLRIVELADAAATYTHYGAAETTRANPALNPAVIPHGVEGGVYRPLWKMEDGGWKMEQAKLRAELFDDWVRPEDFLIVNVNRHDRRKGLVNCLQVLAELKKTGKAESRNQKFKLFLHTPMENELEKTSLLPISRQLGLEFEEDWIATDPKKFQGGVGSMTPEQVNLLYNAADLNLTTTLGEGWGLSITEAAAAGLPVVCPDHTSCGEIARRFAQHGRGEQIRLAPLAANALVNINDNSRVRWPVEVVKTAEIVEEIRKRGKGRFPALAGELANWLSWDRIAEAWRKRKAEPTARGTPGRTFQYNRRCGPEGRAPVWFQISDFRISAFVSGERSNTCPGAAAHLANFADDGRRLPARPGLWLQVSVRDRVGRVPGGGVADRVVRAERD